MKLLTALLTAGLALGTVVAAPSAAAAPAQCQYVARNLPLPAGATGSRIWSSSSDDKLVLGEVYGVSHQHGVIWRDGKIWQVVHAPDMIRVNPRAVNKNGVVVGSMSDTRSTTAFRMLIGRYFKLHTEPGYESTAYAINDNGDIAGSVFPSGGGERTAVVWERDKPGYTVIGPGQAIIVTADRKALTNEGLLFDLNTKTSVSLGAREPFSLDNGRIFGWGFGSIPEWNTSGQLVARYDLGVQGLGVNNHNTLFGGYGPTRIDPGLWRNGTWTAIQADKMPDPWGYGDISDDEVITGNYRTDHGDFAAQWFCAP
ncbi:hypothetical protein DMH04_17460 [Kibdelosporangium aridum]|uniref:Uncharacterized protein n=1 Tax=Kibdelosporangium aridum TaxID=2030 RepID=A0A428ZBS6_KIBAR|nr:hypothetical protein [Kibdelosporangium aridum]RSM85537.1 hypothetical protein DMH04_17460 [Kibdelosporangium aridum]